MNVRMSKVFFPAAASQLKMPRCFIGCYWKTTHDFYFCRMGSRMQRFSRVQHMRDRKSGAKRKQIIRKAYGEPLSTGNEGPRLSKYVCLYEKNNP